MFDEETRGTATTDPARSRPVSYDVFISYTHALDGALAPALQRGLHQLARPWYRIRALRVFRDKTNLAANPDLWSAIETALASSRFLILLCSPHAASSRWVRKEVEYTRIGQIRIDTSEERPPVSLRFLPDDRHLLVSVSDTRIVVIDTQNLTVGQEAIEGADLDGRLHVLDINGMERTKVLDGRLATPRDTLDRSRIQ